MAFKRDDYYEELCRLRRYLHQHPELSMEEYETSKFIFNYLTQCNISCEILENTGVIGTLMINPDYKTIAVRSEIDALPIQEDTRLSFASAYPGKMHGCGHDAITAVALCLAKALSSNTDELKCNVRFIFEPGEEIGQGAKYMISHGALENPHVDEVLVYHYGNQDPRSMEIQKSISTAVIGSLVITVKGKSSHWSQSGEGKDALYAASRLAVEIHDLNLNLKTDYPFVLGFGLLQAGTAGNIMADTASLTGSLRTFTEKDFEFVWNKLHEKMCLIEEETGTTISLEILKKTPPITNNPQLVEKGTKIGQAILGDKFFLGEDPFLVGDNASFYMEHIPGMRVVFLAGRADQKNYPVHNPKFDIDETVMSDNLEFLYRMLTEEY